MWLNGKWQRASSCLISARVKGSDRNSFQSMQRAAVRVGSSVRRSASVASSAPVNSWPQLSGTAEHKVSAVCVTEVLFTHLLKSLCSSWLRIRVKSTRICRKTKKETSKQHGYSRCCSVLTSKPPRGCARSPRSERKWCRWAWVHPAGYSLPLHPGSIRARTCPACVRQTVSPNPPARPRPCQPARCHWTQDRFSSLSEGQHLQSPRCPLPHHGRGDQIYGTPMPLSLCQLLLNWHVGGIGACSLQIRLSHVGRPLRHLGPWTLSGSVSGCAAPLLGQRSDPAWILPHEVELATHKMRNLSPLWRFGGFGRLSPPRWPWRSAAPGRSQTKSSSLTEI